MFRQISSLRVVLRDLDVRVERAVGRAMCRDRWSVRSCVFGIKGRRSRARDPLDSSRFRASDQCGQADRPLVLVS